MRDDHGRHGITRTRGARGRRFAGAAQAGHADAPAPHARSAASAAQPFAQCYAPPEKYRGALPEGRFYSFFDTIEEQGFYLSEDLSFCRRVRLGGGSVWALVDQTVVHYGASEVAGQYLRALRMRGNIG